MLNHTVRLHLSRDVGVIRHVEKVSHSLLRGWYPPRCSDLVLRDVINDRAIRRSPNCSQYPFLNLEGLRPLPARSAVCLRLRTGLPFQLRGPTTFGDKCHDGAHIPQEH